MALNPTVHARRATNLFAPNHRLICALSAFVCVFPTKMDQRANPYTPGSGVRPRKLAGRDAELRACGVLLEPLGGRKRMRARALQALGVLKAFSLGIPGGFNPIHRLPAPRP